MADDDRDGDAPVGRLTAETLDERRARLVVAPPPSRRRRYVVVAAVLLSLGAGVFLGVVPGSGAVGRYPVWQLHELADRIDRSNAVAEAGCPGLDTPRAEVDLLTGRVEASATMLILTADEEAMLTRTGYAQVSTGPAYPEGRSVENLIC